MVEPYPSRNPAVFVFEKIVDQVGVLYLDLMEVYEVAEYLIRSSYVLCGERKRVHRIVRGVPTGTNAAPEMTNTYLFYYELNFWMKQLPKWDELT
jgi:hypothetical protein